MFHNPTAAVNLFHVGKQYLTFCKAEAAVTHNLIGRKIISNVKHSDARNSLPILDVIRSSHKRHSAPDQSTANERYVKRQVSVIRVYTCSERHLTFRRNIDTRRQWSVGNIGWDEWLYWEIVISDHCHGSVKRSVLSESSSSFLKSFFFIHFCSEMNIETWVGLVSVMHLNILNMQDWLLQFKN